MPSQQPEKDSAYAAAYRREKAARRKAEDLLERRSRELYEAQQELAAEHARLKAAHAELQTAQAQLVQSEKMATVGQLAAGVAHEINNPMAFIKSNLKSLEGYVESIQRFVKASSDLAKQAGESGADELRTAAANVAKVNEDEELDYVLEDLTDVVSESLEGADRIVDIVANLKNFSRVDQAKLAEADINENLRSTLKIAWNDLKYKCVVNTEFTDIPSVECNVGELNQVFLNLLVNAGQAIDENGEIVIATRLDGANVVVSIKDNGCGMTDEVAGRIFEPFFTTKDVGSGTGLGLSLSYAIVEKHGGTITVESEPGVGTEFTVVVPVRPAAQDAA